VKLGAGMLEEDPMCVRGAENIWSFSECFGMIDGGTGLNVGKIPVF